MTCSFSFSRKLNSKNFVCENKSSRSYRRCESRGLLNANVPTADEPWRGQPRKPAVTGEGGTLLQPERVQIVDLLIVGGGINGAGIARDAAGRGLKVLLVEQADLASATSSASTKLIHGGLRYLEYYEFRLVREALIEREVLLRKRHRTSSGRSPSCCRMSRRCARPG